MRLAFSLKKIFLSRSLRGRLLLGLALIWLLVVTLVLGTSWHLGKQMVHETNMSHLRYEATLLADEVTQQVELRFQALERLREMIGPTDDT
ncbi:MAG: diguanylate cyclase, partial [Gammaproteobacteria bacterium]|nr:diguanylate cyclase [Gammaproteobacteria bacterium]